jgi:hypothetical protein
VKFVAISRNMIDTRRQEAIREKRRERGPQARTRVQQAKCKKHGRERGKRQKEARGERQEAKAKKICSLGLLGHGNA